MMDMLSIAYNSKKVGSPITSWNDLLRKEIDGNWNKTVGQS